MKLLPGCIRFSRLKHDAGIRAWEICLTPDLWLQVYRLGVQVGRRPFESKNWRVLALWGPR